MMDTLKPYPEYKDSGLTWLGCIPQHWEVRRNGRLFMQRNSTGYGRLPILEVSLRTGVRVRNMDNLKRKQVISDRNKYKRAAKGDIAYNMMRMWQGAVGVAPVDGLVSPAYVVVRPRPEVEPRYFSYLFRTDIYKKEVDGFSRGIVKDRNRLYWEDFKRIPSCFPSLAEQKIIADYLDANAAKVRRFIRNRRRLMEVLNEQKQAIINRAVTRGLDLDVSLKPSGIDWLGDIPQHWDVARLKNVATVVLGKMLKSTPSPGYKLRPYLRSANIQWWKPRLDDVAKMWFTESEMDTYRISAGDLLVSEGGEVGRSCLWEDELKECYIQNSVHKVSTGNRLLPKFLLLQFFALGKSGRFEFIVNRVSIGHLTREKLVNVRVVIPPIEDQNEIILQIGEQTISIDTAIDRATREINLILEYRTRLISDVVTGKIDVRHLAPPRGNEDLEDMAEAIEPLEDVMADVVMDDEEEEVDESD
jgi:type I restriction enzyme S subunit